MALNCMVRILHDVEDRVHKADVPRVTDKLLRLGYVISIQRLDWRSGCTSLGL